MIKKKLLFLTSRLPYPPISGYNLRSYWLLKILSKYFDTHLVSIVGQDHVPREFYQWAKDVGISYNLFYKKPMQSVFNTFSSIYNNQPLQVNYYYFKDLQEYINEKIEEFDILFASLIRTAQYIKDFEKPKFLDMIDSIAINYMRSKDKTTSLKWKLLYSIEIPRLLKYEKQAVDKFDKTFLVNQEEASFFDNRNKVKWLPNGVDERLFNYDKIDNRYSNYVVFFGKMDYQPNIDAVLWFIRNVLSHLNEGIKLMIVGINPTKKLVKIANSNPRIQLTGYVEDPYIFLKSSLAVVAPMQTGAGMQNKVLESMALGCINIVSSLAAKPIGGEDMKEFIIRDNPKEIVDIIHDVWGNPKKYEYIKYNAREYIKNKFTWEIVEKVLIKEIEEVLNNHLNKSTI